MVQQRIRVYARLKPSNDKPEHYRIVGRDSIDLFIPKIYGDNLIDNRKDHYSFSFEHIFGLISKQDEIFEHVAVPVIKGVLDGFNGTIFAYGQTGSGKTYTMTGNLKKMEDRGIIMRCIEYFFQHFEKHKYFNNYPELLFQNKNTEFLTSISYLEIYNENGFDLLSRRGHRLEDFEKVYLMEDKEQHIHLKNLSMNVVHSKDEAYSLLFNGDLNREICQTPLNSSSTRSHCIFTFHLTSTSGRMMKISKLHLVDLAGSERVSRTGADGTLLIEAKHINLSLHHLEQVILALSEKKRQHVPYRNCFLTSVLRDSLGGNCTTSMIATCSSEIANVEETLSTCRFAQRVSQICNEIRMNEGANDENLLEHLKQENNLLRMQLNLRIFDNVSVEKLSGSEIKQCEEAVEKFVANGEYSNDIIDPRMIYRCFLIFKDKLNSSDGNACSCIHSKKLENLLKLRDNEIEILVNELKKMKAKDVDNSALSTHGQKMVSPDKLQSLESLPSAISSDEYRPDQNNVGRQKAFDSFKILHKDYKLMKAMKTQLKQLASEAKEIGNEVTRKKTTIHILRDKVEKQRISKTVTGSTPDSMEKELTNLLYIENRSYIDMVESLKNTKLKHDRVNSSLKQIKEMILSDFEVWWSAGTNT